MNENDVDEEDSCDGCGEIYTGTERICRVCGYVFCGDCLDDGCPHCTAQDERKR